MGVRVSLGGEGEESQSDCGFRRLGGRLGRRAVGGWAAESLESRCYPTGGAPLAKGDRGERPVSL
jgi:hypothetical protein